MKFFKREKVFLISHREKKSSSGADLLLEGKEGRRVDAPVNEGGPPQAGTHGAATLIGSWTCAILNQTCQK